MSEKNGDPIAGKGVEMLPDKGNPFQETNPEENVKEKYSISDWENERALDLSSSSKGRSSRLARQIDARELSQEPSSSKETNASPEQSGSISGFLTGQEIPAASLIVEKEDKSPEPQYTKPDHPVKQNRQPDELAALLERAKDAHWKVKESIDSIEIARELLDEIQRAKNLLQNKENGGGEAERLIAGIEYRLSLADKTAHWSSREGRAVLWYEIAWFALVIALFFVLPLLNLQPAAAKVIMSALAGSLGGVFAAVYALWRHISEKQDYNPKHNIWYYIQPIMGLPIGGFIYLLFFSVIQFSAGGTADVSNGTLMYLISAIAGFQQNAIYSLARRISKLFRPQQTIQ